MRIPSPIRREIALVAAVSALALAPLLFLGLKSAFGPRPQIARVAPAPRPALRPVLREESGGNSRPLLSPDGRWIARLEFASPQSANQTAPGKSSPLANELVVRAARNGQEVFREFASGQLLGWLPQTGVLATQNGLDLNLWIPTVRKPGAPAPPTLWAAKTISFASDFDLVDQETGANGAALFRVQRAAIALSPDGRFAVKASWQRGNIIWRVADLNQGRVAPAITAGRWLDYDPKMGGYTNEISVAIGPAPRAPGALPLVAVMQKVPKTKPVTPVTGASPTPRPTQTAEQKRFLAEDERLAQKRMAEVTETDAGKRLEALKNSDFFAEQDFNNKRQAEFRRLFPPTAEQRRRAEQPRIADGPVFQLAVFDLNRSQAKPKTLWKKTLHSDVFMPQAQFSPDGSTLVAWGTARIVRQDDRGRTLQLQGSGLEFLAPRTGKTRAAFRLYGRDFSIPRPGQALFTLPASGQNHSILTVQDARSIKAPYRTPKGRLSTRFRPVQTLRFFDTFLAREVGYLDMSAPGVSSGFTIEELSTDDFGRFYLFGQNNFGLASRAQLGNEKSGALPPPTPSPAF